MVIQKDIQDYVENHIKFMVRQTESYLPFIKIAFPKSSKSEAEGYFILIPYWFIKTDRALPTIRLKQDSAKFCEYGKAILMKGRYDSVCLTINSMWFST